MNKWLAYLTLVGTLSMIVWPYLITLIFGFPFKNGVNIFIEPASYSFGVFYLIHIGCIALGVYQAQPKLWSNPKFIQIRKYLLLNILGHNLWILAIALAAPTWQVFFGTVVLYTLFRLARIAEIGKASKNPKEQYLVKVPLSIYFGWITIIFPVALIGFFIHKWQIAPERLPNMELISVLVLIGAFLVVIVQFLKRQVDLAYILVIIWGLFAIFIANMDMRQSVAFSALGLSVGLLVTYFIVERQQMELSKIEMELTALRNQVNPHFLFNNLNTLANLIPLESENAHNYLDKLAKFYRYIVSQREEHLIPLEEELAGVKNYIAILKERFGENLQVQINCSEAFSKTVLPLSLQLLIENAVKHNVISDNQQLSVHIFVDQNGSQLNIENNINERMHELESTGMGLSNIQQRYKHFTNEQIKIESKLDKFCVRLPLMETGYESINYRGRTERFRYFKQADPKISA